MSKLRSINTSFWSDPFIETLDPKQKLLFLYLVTNEKTNMLGIYENSVKKISFETGLTILETTNALKEFELIGKIKRKNHFIILVNYMKHQNYNTNMKKSAIDVYNKLPIDLKINDLNVSKECPLKGFESLLKGYGMVSKVEIESELEVEKEKELEVEEENTLHNINILKDHYLSKERVLNSVINDKQNKVKDLADLKEKLNLFCDDLNQQGRHSEKWLEFTRYFINSLRIGKFDKKEVSQINSRSFSL